ncbi:MAG: Fe-S cluster assembly protein SufD [Gemmatimonadales bacterium]
MTETLLRDFEAFTANGGSAGPDWLPGLRRRGFERFTTLGFPTSRNEDWKFTSVAPIAQTPFRRPAPEEGATGRMDLTGWEFGHPEWTELVFLNGRYRADLSSARSLPPGVKVVTLARMLADDPEFVRHHLGQIAPAEQQAFTALNQAFATDGVVVHVAGGVTVPGPIHLIFLADPAGGPAASHLRNLVIAEPQASVSVVESFGSRQEGVYFTNAVTEVRVGDGALVEHIKIQRESQQAYHVQTIEARQGRDSRFRSFSFAIGAALSRTNIYSTMAEPGSDCTMNGLYVAGGSQHVDHQTRIEHAAPNCTSWEVYKGILDGTSHAVFNGKVYVRPEAQKTDGKQTNKNLLLSEGARVDTKPQLEIFADDVKCTHGATVGRLDEIAEFYLQSRGIPLPLARRILTYGFAADVLTEVTQEPIRTRLEQIIFGRLSE